MWEVHQSAVRIEKETEGGRRKKKKKKNVWPTSSGGVVTGSRDKNTGTWTHIFPTVRAWLKRPLFLFPPLSPSNFCVCVGVCVCVWVGLSPNTLSLPSLSLYFLFFASHLVPTPFCWLLLALTIHPMRNRLIVRDAGFVRKRSSKME